MDFTRQISQMFHDEHLATVATLERFELLLHSRRRGPPVAPDTLAEFARTLCDVETLIASDVAAHFAFEEAHLFPLLAESGDGEMGALLTEEHNSILVVARQLAGLCRTARDGAARDGDWHEVRRLGADFVEQMISHIQKEEMGLLLTLDYIVDEARDRELVMAYAAAR